VDATKMEACLQTGALRKPRQGDVPANTVMKVIKVALVSRDLNPEFRAFLKI
jgi:hypothetical protein